MNNIVDILENSKKQIVTLFEGFSDAEKQNNKVEFDKMINQIDEEISKISKAIQDASK